MILALLLFGILFALLFVFFVCLWVYKDCEVRGEHKFLWPLIVFFASPIVGLIIYLICRKEEPIACTSCQKGIKKTAVYCEYCGSKNEESTQSLKLNPKKHLKFLVAGGVCLILMIGCLSSFAVGALLSDNFYDRMDTALENTFSNPGISISTRNTKIGNKWNFSVRYASDGQKESRRFNLKEEATVLLIDIEMEEGDLQLIIEQKGIKEVIEINQLDEPIEYSLENFETGRFRTTLAFNGARNVKGTIELK